MVILHSKTILINIKVPVKVVERKEENKKGEEDLQLMKLFQVNIPEEKYTQQLRQIQMNQDNNLSINTFKHHRRFLIVITIQVHHYNKHRQQRQQQLINNFIYLTYKNKRWKIIKTSSMELMEWMLQVHQHRV